MMRMHWHSKFVKNHRRSWRRRSEHFRRWRSMRKHHRMRRRRERRPWRWRHEHERRWRTWDPWDPRDHHRWRKWVKHWTATKLDYLHGARSVGFVAGIDVRRLFGRGFTFACSGRGRSRRRIIIAAKEIFSKFSNFNSRKKFFQIYQIKSNLIANAEQTQPSGDKYYKILPWG